MVRLLIKATYVSAAPVSSTSTDPSMSTNPDENYLSQLFDGLLRVVYIAGDEKNAQVVGLPKFGNAVVDVFRVEAVVFDAVKQLISQLESYRSRVDSGVQDKREEENAGGGADLIVRDDVAPLIGHVADVVNDWIAFLTRVNYDGVRAGMHNDGPLN